jgi:hypothetical protein
MKGGEDWLRDGGRGIDEVGLMKGGGGKLVKGD